MDDFMPQMLNFSKAQWTEMKNKWGIPSYKGTTEENVGTWWRLGTLWCGKGTDAKSYDDLGPDAETDKCCRAHDHCPISIDSGVTKCGIANNCNNPAIPEPQCHFTVSGCDCDNALRSCLADRNKLNADVLGWFFGQFMKVCVDNSTGTCVLKNETFDFNKKIMNKVDNRSALANQISTDSLREYACLTHMIYSGNADIGQCVLTCDIGSPFADHTDHLAGYDCSIISTLCCDWQTDWCSRAFPLLMGASCPEKPPRLTSAEDGKEKTQCESKLNWSKSEEMRSLQFQMTELRKEMEELQLSLTKEIFNLQKFIEQTLEGVNCHPNAI